MGGQKGAPISISSVHCKDPRTYPAERLLSHTHFSMAYTQPHPRLSVVSSSSQSSADHLSPTTTSTRFSLPSVPSNKPPLNRPNIYDRNLNKTRAAEVSSAAFAFLFSEIIQYTQKRVSGINDLERQ